jgi:hypothetical protein
VTPGSRLVVLTTILVFDTLSKVLSAKRRGIFFFFCFVLMSFQQLMDLPLWAPTPEAGFSQWNLPRLFSLALEVPRMNARTSDSSARFTKLIEPYVELSCGLCAVAFFKPSKISLRAHARALWLSWLAHQVGSENKCALIAFKRVCFTELLTEYLNTL